MSPEGCCHKNLMYYHARLARNMLSWKPSIFANLIFDLPPISKGVNSSRILEKIIVGEKSLLLKKVIRYLLST